MDTEKNIRLKLRSDTAENWNTINPTLLRGELALDPERGTIRIGNNTSYTDSVIANFKVDAMGYKITEVTETGYKLTSISGIETGMRISARLATAAIDCAEITAINEETNEITLDPMPTMEFDTDEEDLSINFIPNYITIVDHPELGDTYIGFGTYAIGENVLASERGAFAEGRLTKALGQYGHAEGRSTIAGFAAHAEGRNTKALGDVSHAAGRATTSIGFASMAQGEDSKSIGRGSHAEGQATESNEIYSHSEGLLTKANGIASHAEGEETIVTSRGSHVEGLKTAANGSYSHAEGAMTEVASDAVGSHAEGNRAIASGNYAHVEGIGTTASGEGSHAEGKGSEASGDNAHAEGYYTRASGPQAHAEGHATTASGDSAHAEGEGSKASGGYAHAEGCHTEATFYYAHAEGHTTQANGAYSHAEGEDSKATGQCSHAEGTLTTAEGISSHSEGKDTTAAGAYSHTEGISTSTTSDYSHAEGHTTTASGTASHAEGQLSQATAWATHAEGGDTRASGTFAHSEGWLTKATGTAAHAGGRGTIATAEAQTAIGIYNAEDADALFIVGNGTSASDRKNALTVKKDGTLSITKDLGDYGIEPDTYPMYENTSIDGGLKYTYEGVGAGGATFTASQNGIKATIRSGFNNQGSIVMNAEKIELTKPYANGWDHNGYIGDSIALDANGISISSYNQGTVEDGNGNSYIGSGIRLSNGSLNLWGAVTINGKYPGDSSSNPVSPNPNPYVSYVVQPELHFPYYGYTLGDKIEITRSEQYVLDRTISIKNNYSIAKWLNNDRTWYFKVTLGKIGLWTELDEDGDTLWHSNYELISPSYDQQIITVTGANLTNQNTIKVGHWSASWGDFIAYVKINSLDSYTLKVQAPYWGVGVGGPPYLTDKDQNGNYRNEQYISWDLYSPAVTKYELGYNDAAGELYWNY